MIRLLSRSSLSVEALSVNHISFAYRLFFRLGIACVASVLATVLAAAPTAAEVVLNPPPDCGGYEYTYNTSWTLWGVRAATFCDSTFDYVEVTARLERRGTYDSDWSTLMTLGPTREYRNDSYALLVNNTLPCEPAYQYRAVVIHTVKLPANSDTTTWERETSGRPFC